MTLEFATVVAITVICYLAGVIVSNSKLDNKWIPAICGILGGIIGFIGFAINMPEFPAHDPITAIAVGIASGLAATGGNELFKQLFVKKTK